MIPGVGECRGCLRTSVCVYVCAFMIQRRRVLQQSEKVGQTPTSEKHSRGKKEVESRDGKERGKKKEHRW